MQPVRNYALTIAGFDPCGGAGLTADIKTFEQHKVYGLSVCTAVTVQTENEFFEVRWEKIEDILKSIEILLTKYPVSVIKTGILPSLEYLSKIVDFLSINYPEVKIIIDPIYKSSTGFDLFKSENKTLYYDVLKKSFLITPNIIEAIFITGLNDETKAAEEISEHCNVFLKGGHSQKNPGTDYLFHNNEIIEFSPSEESVTTKHGSGCILSASIAANLALGFSLPESCKKAKEYIQQILSSNKTLLGYHHV